MSQVSGFFRHSVHNFTLGRVELYRGLLIQVQNVGRVGLFVGRVTYVEICRGLGY